jgi:hypothetical protein
MQPRLAEAQAWGLQVHAIDTGEGIDAGAPVLESLQQLRELEPIDPAAASLRTVLETAPALNGEVNGACTLPISGPFAIAEALLGRARLLESVAREPREAAHALAHVVACLAPWIDAVARTGCPAAVFEADYAPTELPPPTFDRVVAESLSELVLRVRRATHESPSLFVDGNTAPIAGLLAATGAGQVNCPDTTSQTLFLAAVRKHRDLEVRVDLPRRLWTGASWHSICDEISVRAGYTRLHANILLGTGPLPLHASSVLVVDACHFTTNMDPWLGAS